VSLLHNAIVTIYTQVVHQPSGIRRFWFGVSLLSPLRPILRNGNPLLKFLGNAFTGERILQRPTPRHLWATDRPRMCYPTCQQLPSKKQRKRSFLLSSHFPSYDFDLRASHARTLPPAALASVPFGFVLVRVRVQKQVHSSHRGIKMCCLCASRISPEGQFMPQLVICWHLVPPNKPAGLSARSFVSCHVPGPRDIFPGCFCPS